MNDNNLISRQAVVNLIQLVLNSSKSSSLEHQRIRSVLREIEQLPVTNMEYMLQYIWNLVLDIFSSTDDEIVFEDDSIIYDDIND